MNFEVIWANELTILTGVEFPHIYETFQFVESMYARSFPESAKNQ